MLKTTITNTFSFSNKVHIIYFYLKASIKWNLDKNKLTHKS